MRNLRWKLATDFQKNARAGPPAAIALRICVASANSREDTRSD
jgi:hypothetical protein